MNGAILIDANSFSKGNMKQEIEDRLLSGELAAITSPGTRLERELSRAASQFYSNLRQAGRLIVICPRSVRNKTRQLKASNELESDDPHVVAVAITSAVNVLVSDDKPLAKDFKNCRKLDQQTRCRRNSHLGNKDTRKVIRKTTKQKDVDKFLCMASCGTTECPCIKLGKTC